MLSRSASSWAVLPTKTDIIIPKSNCTLFQNEMYIFSDYTFNSNFTSSLPFNNSKVLAKLFS